MPRNSQLHQFLLPMGHLISLETVMHLLIGSSNENYILFPCIFLLKNTFLINIIKIKMGCLCVCFLIFKKQAYCSYSLYPIIPIIFSVKWVLRYFSASPWYFLFCNCCMHGSCIKMFSGKLINMYVNSYL